MKQESQTLPVAPSVPAEKAIADDLDEWDWEFAAIFQHIESCSPPDEVGTPLPATYTEAVLLPRKWDAECFASKYVKVDNLDDFIKPIHETVSWLGFEFDPAFVREGHFPNGEAVADYIDRIRSFDFSESEAGHEDSGEKSDKFPQKMPPVEEHINVESTQTHIDINAEKVDSETDAGNTPPEREERSEEIGQDVEASHPSPGIPRTRIRKRSREPRRSPKSSRDSRRSSVSSQSSLSSLEAELLGRPPKRKRSDIPRRRRLDSHPRQQPGRWPSVASSAYRYDEHGSIYEMPVLIF
ncbi:hypothetical protein HJFPF1_06219 [Paramyrothecium foliicola]|nr:hypothetical protein HJFPF1_06219 [Paramyrothecium foliicola]